MIKPPEPRLKPGSVQGKLVIKRSRKLVVLRELAKSSFSRKGVVDRASIDSSQWTKDPGAPDASVRKRKLEDAFVSVAHDAVVEEQVRNYNVRLTSQLTRTGMR